MSVFIELEIRRSLVVEIFDLRQHQREVTLTRFPRHVRGAFADVRRNRGFADQAQFLDSPVGGRDRSGVSLRRGLQFVARADRAHDFTTVRFAHEGIGIVKLFDRGELRLGKFEIRAQPFHRILLRERARDLFIASGPKCHEAGGTGGDCKKDERGY